MTTIETTTTAPSTSLMVLRCTSGAQQDAAYEGLDKVMNLADVCMNKCEDMQRPELSKAFVEIYDAAIAVGAVVQTLAETAGCDGYSSLAFKPTTGDEPLIQRLQVAINMVNMHVEDAVDRIVSVSAMAAMAVESEGVSRFGSYLRGTFQALHDMARDCIAIIESCEIEETEDAETVRA
ncbi:MAG: hypothetical protein RBU21_18300 [FCB group bacterium]|jgi:hypothetical protein|nr:hypothetical protein [FCB group bacterium]